MRNIPLVISREYLTRVKKKSFIIMTLLAPVLISAFYGGIIWVSTNDQVGAKDKFIVVNDESGVFRGKIDKVNTVNFSFQDEYNRDSLLAGTADGFIHIKEVDLHKPLQIAYESQGSLSAKETSSIENAFKNEMERIKLEELGVSQGAMDSLNSKVNINELKIDENGKAKSNSIIINTIVGMGLSIMIYFFIFLYGVQVMRGVIEEKTNRIVELMISSLKPFELMMGKVIGIAAVGLTQLGIWIVLSTVLTLIISTIFGIDMSQGMDANPMMASGQVPEMNGKLTNIIAAFIDLPLLKIFGLFIFYFLGGYLLYGALFAAIGSAVDSETDTQQFMMPVTLPLVFSFIVSFSVVINDPNGVLAVWLSMIPISSPIVMMSRIPFDPPTWQIVLSMISLVLTILLVIWLAGRIYRTGILMYGKKPSYKEIAKWLFYKK
ncbi:MAG: ABC transporter permease [Bacteroidia bacterium]